ncbi:WD40-repeat-containing domain protein [Suillus occidentalis]|nr:WD40-repeat-containing domain protein [Suillus occidentalis]
MSYFPDGQRMISGSDDKTARQWDLKGAPGKEIKDARSDCKGWVCAVAVSKNGRWVATGGGDWKSGELKVCEVETGIVKTFKGHSLRITCIDISADNMWLASGSFDETARIWNLDTSKLVAGPFKGEDPMGAVRYSPNSKKLAVRSWWGMCLEVWDVQSQKLDVKVGKDSPGMSLPRLALSFDNALLASASYNDTIKLWAFESRHLLASFDVQNLWTLVLSPDSRQLAYTTSINDDHEICICVTPPDILAQACKIARTKANLDRLLHSHATRSPAVHRKPPICAIPTVQRPPPTRDLQQPTFRRLSSLLRFSPRTNSVRPGRKDQSRDPLDFPATSPLPSNRIHAESAPSTSLPGRSTFFLQIFSSPITDSLSVISIPIRTPKADELTISSTRDKILVSPVNTSKESLVEAVMASTSTTTTTGSTESILTPPITLNGHGGRIRSISYLPDSQRMISGSSDKTAWQWDVKVNKENDEGQDVCEEEVWEIAVSRDGRWIITAGGDVNGGVLKACKINCVDISVDNTLLASGADDFTARIWNLDTGKLVAGPFKRWAQFDSQQTRRSSHSSWMWGVGVMFEAHTKVVTGLTPSFDGTLLANFGEDYTIKLWAWEPHQLLASFDVQNPQILVLSPDSRQFAYVTNTEDDQKICICDIPSNVLVQAHARMSRKRLLSDRPLHAER